MMSTTTPSSTMARQIGPHIGESQMHYSCVIFVLFGHAGTIANVIQILLLLRKRKDMSIFQLTLISLSFTDAIASILFAAGGNIIADTLAQRNGMPIPRSTLSILRLSKDYFVLTSLFHILFITVQRYAAVSFPLRYKTLFTKGRAVFTLVFIWSFTLAITSVAVFLLGDKKLYWQITAYCFCFLGALLLLLYSLITYRIAKQRKWMQRINATSQDNGFSVKLLVNSFGVTIMFMLCTLPNAGSILEIGSMKDYNLLFSSFLAVKAFADPIFYFFVNMCNLKCCDRSNGRGHESSESTITICKNQQ